MIIDPLSNSNEKFFETYLSDEKHLSKPKEESKFPDLERITEQIFNQTINSHSTQSYGFEKNNDELSKCWKGIDLEDEDLLLAAIEEDEDGFNEETEAIKEDEIGINDEMEAAEEDEAHVSEETLAVQEGFEASQEIEEENQLNIHGKKIEQESERDVDEGALKTVTAEEEVQQINTDIGEVNVNASDIIEDTKHIDDELKNARNFAQLNQSFIHQYNELIDQKEFTTNNNNILTSNLIPKTKMEINTNMNKEDRISYVQDIVQMNLKQFNNIYSQNKINFNTIIDSIKHELKKDCFTNVYDENGIPLNEDETGVEQLTKNIQDYKKDHSEENLSEIIQHRIGEWIASKNLHTKNSEGELVPISPQRQKELATILSSGIIIQIVYQVTHSQKLLQKDKTENDRLALATHAGREVSHQLFRINDQKVKGDFPLAIDIPKKKGVDTSEIKMRAKSLDKLNLDIIDQAQRISEMTSAKEIIKGEVEHLDLKHVITVIDRVRLRKLKEIN